MKQLDLFNDDTASFQKIKSRKKKDNNKRDKMSKAAENLIADLQSQVSILSSQLLILKKLYRVTYRMLSPEQQAEIDEVRSRETISSSNRLPYVDEE